MGVFGNKALYRFTHNEWLRGAITLNIAVTGIIYPICYFIMCIILGAKDGFYPYPFLNGKQMWDMLFKAKPYDPTMGVLLLVAAVVILSGVFFGVACGLGGIHNKRLGKPEPAKEKLHK